MTKRASKGMYGLLQDGALCWQATRSFLACFILGLVALQSIACRGDLLTTISGSNGLGLAGS